MDVKGDRMDMMLMCQRVWEAATPNGVAAIGGYSVGSKVDERCFVIFYLLVMRG